VSIEVIRKIIQAMRMFVEAVEVIIEG
jgi:hypothetical protein